MKLQSLEYIQQLLSFNKPIIDSMTRNIAILDENGIIVQTNKAWDLFNKSNGGDSNSSGIGANYLNICKRGNEELYIALQQLIDSKIEEVINEYPCHSEHGMRWFMMYANIFECKNENGSFRGILVEHINITDRKILEMKAKEDLNLARKVQLDLLPKDINNKKIKTNSFYQACEALSGDIYYWKEIDKDLYIVSIFDLVGHGTAASLLSMNAFATFTYIIEQSRNLREIVIEMNHHLHKIYDNHHHKGTTYCTAIILLINLKTQTIEYINCGHPPGILWLNQEKVTLLDKGTIPLGIMNNLPVIERGKVQYQSSSRILLYTDGLIENMNSNLSDGQEKLQKEIKQQKFDIRKLINKEQVLSDDVTIVSVDLPAT